MSKSGGVVSLPPWKRELLLRGNALAKAVDPNGSARAGLLDDSAPRMTTTSGSSQQQEQAHSLSSKGTSTNSTTSSTGRRLLKGTSSTSYQTANTGVPKTVVAGGSASAVSSGKVLQAGPTYRACLSSSREEEERRCNTSASRLLSLCCEGGSGVGSDPRSSSSQFVTKKSSSNRASISPLHPLLLSQGSHLIPGPSLPSILSGMILASPAIVVTDQEESLLLMDKAKRGHIHNLKHPSSSSLDSDDGSSSSSGSEELAYGPGFVSRLKSRYMRSALRSSHFTNLRRTASLEDFLDKETTTGGQPSSSSHPEEEVELLQQETTSSPPPRLPRRTWRPPPSYPSSSRSRGGDSMKRCKSVEVLSRNRLPPPPSETPPPLPPKSASSSTQRLPLDLNVSPGLLPERRVLLRDRKPKELPATDIVKQTRKLFESKSSPLSSSPNVLVSSIRPTNTTKNSRAPRLPLKSKGFPPPNPLELPPKQIGIIRPISRSKPKEEEPPTSKSFLKEQVLKSKDISEVDSCPQNNTNSNTTTTTALVSDKKTLPSRRVAPKNNTNTHEEVSTKSSNKQKEPAESSSFPGDSRSSKKSEDGMCEFKSIVLKEVKKELGPGGVRGVPKEPEIIPEDLTGEEEEPKGLLESKNVTFRDTWKARHEGKNTLVFNFINSKKDVSHIENDGLDLSKRKKTKPPQSGVIILDSLIPNESTDDDGTGVCPDEELEEELLRPPSPCSIVFIGGNLISGKSSLRSAPASSKNLDKKQMSISFSSSLEEVFEYPSFESTLMEDEASRSANSTKTTNGGGGGLGSYTPSKNQLSETPFQLGVSRTPSSTNKSSKEVSSSKDDESPDQVLRPVEDAVSWSGSSSSSDILF